MRGLCGLIALRSRTASHALDTRFHRLNHPLRFPVSQVIALLLYWPRVRFVSCLRQRISRKALRSLVETAGPERIAINDLSPFWTAGGFRTAIPVTS